jgi:hypothetical protein
MPVPGGLVQRKAGMERGRLLRSYAMEALIHSIMITNTKMTASFFPSVM